MQVNIYTTNVFGNQCTMKLMDFDDDDRKQWKVLFDNWNILNKGMRDYKARGINMPEGISEVAFCLFTGSKRFVSLTHGNSPASFDTYNVETQRTEQIKACSVASDLTSFGPKSKWDDLYFMDFYNDGNIDGSFDLYKIPTIRIHSMNMNRTQTFTQQQDQGRRPRFSLKKDLILPNNLKPVASKVRIW